MASGYTDVAFALFFFSTIYFYWALMPAQLPAGAGLVRSIFRRCLRDKILVGAAYTHFWSDSYRPHLRQKTICRNRIIGVEIGLTTVESRNATTSSRYCRTC